MDSEGHHCRRKAAESILAQPRPELRLDLLGPVRIWLDHPNHETDSALVRGLPLDQLRASLTSHGWVEQSIPSEIGGILASEFAKADIVLALPPSAGADVHGIARVLALQTADRRDSSSQMR